MLHMFGLIRDLRCPIRAIILPPTPPNGSKQPRQRGELGRKAHLLRCPSVRTSRHSDSISGGTLGSEVIRGSRGAEPDTSMCPVAKRLVLRPATTA